MSSSMADPSRNRVNNRDSESGVTIPWSEDAVLVIECNSEPTVAACGVI